MTTILGLVTTRYHGLGKTILATATAWRAAQMLHEELGVEARAVDSLLARARTDRTVLDCNTVLLVDEAGQIGSRAMHSLLTLARERGAKVVLVGDRPSFRRSPPDRPCACWPRSAFRPGSQPSCASARPTP
ncbi:ATP-dependent RecD-like DNA helicase [Methylorubrum aminovorans]|uniref:ATP-dependent RecD-like DNA helicase n=1 Tax=Methylorubrum aminovorans TaxID=269069 RepID=A0ABQ4UM72_9HYPH|nr:ATP-dependent RecD-like DNA helicase [Methylorubrum aminovorans]